MQVIVKCFSCLFWHVFCHKKSNTVQWKCTVEVFKKKIIVQVVFVWMGELFRSSFFTAYFGQEIAVLTSKFTYSTRLGNEKYSSNKHLRTLKSSVV